MKTLLARALRYVMPRRLWYRRVYLKSDHWRKTAALARVRAGHRCERCGRGGALDVHHLTYDHLWREPQSDLKVLCRPCHQRLHRKR